MKLGIWFAIAAAVTLAAAPSASAGRDDGRVRLRCKAEGAQDFSIDAKYEERRGRIKFDSSFEAAPGLGFMNGDVLAVKVGGMTVGEMRLVETIGGDVEGDLNFDTTAQADDDDLPLPADFPDVSDGTGVVIGDLGCDLEED